MRALDAKALRTELAVLGRRPEFTKVALYLELCDSPKALPIGRIFLQVK